MHENISYTEMIKNCKQLISTIENESDFMSAKPAIKELNRNLYWLIKHAMTGRFKKEIVISVLSDFAKMHNEVLSILSDIFSILDAESSVLDSVSNERTNLSTIIKACEKLFTGKLLKERLESDILQEIKVLNNNNFQTKFIKVKTKLYYKQKKFNLFREESEGYAKLITELNQENLTVDYVLKIIMSLIGCFNLDPNRVLDVILDCFENHCDQDEFYVSLIKNFINDSKVLCGVLGFKYKNYQHSTEITPQGLYTITALMLQNNLISFEDIYCWLIPEDQNIINQWKEEFINCDIPYRRGFSTVVVIEKSEPAETIEKQYTESDIEQHAGNQKFGLFEALVHIGDWNNCQKMIKRLPSVYLMAYPPISFSMCELLHPLIDPIYRKSTSLNRLLRSKPVRPLRYPNAPKPAESFLDLRETVFPMLHVLGPYLACDVKLFYKIIRISKAALLKMGVADSTRNAPSEDSIYYDIVTLLDLSILPSLSSLEHDCCVSEEVWDLVKLYPYHIRYCLYGRWKNDTIKEYPHLAWHNAYVQKKAREVMRRISKEPCKVFGRLLGKLSHFCAGSLFDYLLTQILLYDNLISPMIDSFKYLGSMSHDILAYCMIELLATPGRTPTKHKDLTLSNWLVNLAAFSGLIFKRYPIELTGMLQYICNQLKVQQSFDLIFLKELVHKMAGTDISDQITNEQLMALSGGDVLKAEAGYFNHVKVSKKVITRLKDALLQQDLAFSLCLLIAQQRDCIIYKNPGSLHLKLVGKLYDECQETLINYGTFLGSQLSIEEYIEQLPQVHSLFEDYHLQTDVVFFLCRPMINHVINLKFDIARKNEPNFKKLPQTAKLQLYYNSATSVTDALAESIIPFFPIKAWEEMSPQFLFLFWSLNLYDIYIPTTAYSREINKLKLTMDSIPDDKELTASKAKKEYERCNSLIENLQEENKKQLEHAERILYRLNQDKHSWFVSKSQKITKNETITQFLQHCIFPRCTFTMADALFCSKFIHTLHILKTPNFSTLLCYDRLFCDIVYSITLCSENEAHRYGRFLCEMLETVTRWHSDKNIFEQECANYPGFVTKFRVSNQFPEASEHVGYENYRHVCHKWHYKITKSLVVCLESEDYIQIRNALIILIKILPHFPVLVKLAQIIEKKVEKVRNEEKVNRPDLYTLAISYCGLLKGKTSQYIKENEFHYVSPPANPKKVNEDNKPNVNHESQVPVINLIYEDTATNEPKVIVEENQFVVTNIEENGTFSSKEKIKKSTIIDDLSETKTKHRDESSGKEKSQRKIDRKEEEKKSKESRSIEDDKLHKEDRHRDDKERIRSIVHVTSGGSNIQYVTEQNPEDDVRSNSSGSHHKSPFDVIDKDNKRRKVDASVLNNNKSSRHRSASVDSKTSSAKKEKRKIKRLERGFSANTVKKSSTTKRVRNGSPLERKKRKSEEGLPMKLTHQNGGEDHLRNVVHTEKHHRTDKIYHDREKAHERESRDKHYASVNY